MKLGIVILAAGRGKRMCSTLPKVLHPLAGQPLLMHVLHVAHQLGATQQVVVYGHGGEQVRSVLADQDCLWVEQAEQQGTGHAVMQALPVLSGMDRLLVLYGDVPLITPETLRRLLSVSLDTQLGLLIAELPDPTGYGRIIRATDGRVTCIIEEQDATPAERTRTQ